MSKTLYAGNSDGTIRAFNPATAPVHLGSITSTPAVTFRGQGDRTQTGPVRGLAYSPDGKEIMSAGGITKVVLQFPELWTWNPETAAGTFWPRRHQRNMLVNGVAYSPDNQWAVSVSEDSTVKVVPRRGAATEIVLVCNNPSCVAFSPDSKRLAVGTTNEVQVWEKQGATFGGKALFSLTGHTDQVLCVAYSPDGRFLASGSADRTIRMWNAQSGKFLNEIKDRTSAVTSLAFGLDARLLSGHADGSVRIGDTLGKFDIILPPFRDYVSRVRFSSDGNFMFASSWDGTVRGWNNKNVQVFHLNTQGGRVGDLALSSDGQWLVTGQWNGLLHKWSLKALLAR